jgi:hypothetical protein
LFEIISHSKNSHWLNHQRNGQYSLHRQCMFSKALLWYEIYLNSFKTYWRSFIGFTYSTKNERSKFIRWSVWHIEHRNRYCYDLIFHCRIFWLYTIRRQGTWFDYSQFTKWFNVREIFFW